MASPNMNLPVPVPTVTDGPQYAIDEVSCFNKIDSHDHTAGQGVPIPTSGLNINSDLPMNGNAISSCKLLTLQAQSPAPSTNASVYNVGGELYYRDGAGNPVQITSGGSVAGASGNITGLASPASASYSSIGSVFVFQSNTAVAANMDVRNLYLRNSSAGSFRMQLQPPAAMAADIDIVLPSLPSSQKIMTLDASGNMAAPYVVDNSTIEVSANTIQVKNDGITTLKILNGNVTKPKLAAVGQQISSSCGSFTTTSLTPVAVTNLSVTITTTGRPVVVTLIPDGSGTGSYIGSSKSSTTSTSGLIYIERTGITSGSNACLIGADGASGNLNVKVPVGSISLLDVPLAGTYTYSISASGGFSNALTVANAKLIAYEL